MHKHTVPTSLLVLVAALASAGARASDHLDTAAVIADPAADIGDLYAWMSADGRRLNLAMTIVGRKFSDHVHYSFHVDSGPAPGRTAASIAIDCEFNAPTAPDCHLGEADRAHGEAGLEAGLRGANGRFRVFAGLRDDPFFNNVLGTRAALNVAGEAIQGGMALDAGGCPAFGADTAAKIRGQWRRTEGGPARNLLAGWHTAALVVEVAIDVVNRGGPLLGIWAATAVRGITPGHARQLDDGVAIDRMGRALTANMLLGTFDGEDVGNALKTHYNQTEPADWVAFAPTLADNLALYDGFDGRCGNQWLASPELPPETRYTRLALLLADDRLWVNSRARTCAQYLAVESGIEHDCGGRTPNYDAVDVFRSLLMGGRRMGLPDDVNRDDREHSDLRFPFLAPP